MPGADVQQLLVDLRLRDQLTGPVAGAKASLSSLDATARQTGTTLGGLSSSFGAIAKAGVVAFGAFKAFDLAADFLTGSIAAAKEEEAGIARLTAALKANVPAWDENTAAIEKTIAKREELGFADDALRASLGSLVGATHDVQRAFDIQNTAMDLARFKNISLQEATTALITVEAGRFRGLAQLGIVLKQGATQAEALAAVQKVAGGQAEAFANTLAGASERAGVAFHDLQEVIGTPLLTAIGTVADAAAKAAKALGLFVDSAGDLIDRAAKLGQQTGDTSGRIAGLADAIDAVTGAFHLGQTASNNFLGVAKAVSEQTTAQTQAFEDNARAISAIKAGLQSVEPPLDALNNGVFKGAAFFSQFTTAAKDTGSGLDNIDAQARAAAAGLDITHTAASALKDELLAIPRNIDIVVTLNSASVAAAKAEATRIKQLGEDAATGASFGGPAVKPFEQTIPIIDPAVVAFNEAQARERDRQDQERLRKAKERAAELAAAYRDRVSREFDNAKRTATSLFDTLHDRHVRAIKDAETLAEKNHDAALQAISDNLKAQQATHGAPVSAAEAALATRQAAQQRRDLVEALQEAQKGTDQKAIRSAAEALQNFDAAAAIVRLKDVAAGLDAVSQAAADAATKRADSELAAAKAKAQADTDAETKAAAKRKADFERALASLKEADLKAGKSPAQITADIEKLQGRFGITTDRLGFHHIEDPLVTAIKDLRKETPHIVNNFSPSFRVFISAREVAAAIAAGQQPAASASVRTGAAGRV